MTDKYEERLCEGLMNGGMECSREAYSNNNDDDAVEVEGGEVSKKNETFLNYGQEDQMTIQGYKRQRSLAIVSWVLYVLTCGILPLIFFWRPSLKLKLVFKTSSLLHADVVCLKDQYNNIFVEQVKLLERLPRVLDEIEVNQKGDTIETPHEQTMGRLRRLLGGVWRAGRYFENKKVKYMWLSEEAIFRKLRGLEEGSMCSDLHEMGGLSSTDQSEMSSLFGANLIDVPLTPCWKLLLTEALDPLYIFQLFSVVLWFSDNYVYFASIILLISLVILAQSVYEIRCNQKLLKQKIHPSKDVLVYKRDVNKSDLRSSETLVPGDLLEIPKRGCVMQCDAVLLSGDCIVNESMLTGESVPVTKTPLPCIGTPFCFSQHSRHVLFSGTEVIQTRYYNEYKVYAVVLRTGFSTTKGELVRSIMFPKPMDHRFSRDVSRFIIFLLAIASVGMLYTFVVMGLRGDDWWRIVKRALDLVTIVIPPTLPAALTTCVRLAEGRLKRKRIYCLSLRSLNMCGVVEVFCFDKTGTLTEEGLDFKCLLPCSQVAAVTTVTTAHASVATAQASTAPATDSTAPDTASTTPATADSSTMPLTLVATAAAVVVGGGSAARSSDLNIVATPVCSSFGDEVREVVEVLGETDHVVVAMASCHSITIVDASLMGDPMDLKMFEASRWQFELEAQYDDIVPTIIKPPSESKGGSIQVGVVRVFPFSSHLQRMSVITKRLDVDNRYDCYVKGSPEMVSSFCKKHTVPPNFQQTLGSYGQLGYRVIALAYKPLKKSYLKIQQLKRDAVERDLSLLGLLVFENRLKEQSAPVIKLLNSAHIRTLMVTGDNLQTALSVARKCGMLREEDHALLVSIKQQNSSPSSLHPPPSPSRHSPSPSLSSSHHHKPPNEAEEEEEEEATSQHRQLPPSKLPGEAPNKIIDVDDAIDKQVADDIEFTLCEEANKELQLHELEGSSSTFHYVMEGRTWAFVRKKYPLLLKKLARQGTVFARFLPEQKQQLVETLQEDGKFVGMCGDGANDCGALKTAHTGVSLSEAEASVASPFTSNEPNITCVVKIIREGRAALVSSSGNFRFLAGYSLTQFMSICLLYWVGASFTDFIFLYIDLVLIFTLSYTFNRTGAYKHLSDRPPSIALLTPSTVSSILLQLALNTCFLVTVRTLTTQRPWFVPFLDKGDEKYQCHEVTSVFLLSSFQYVILAVVFSKAAPYRKPLYTNGWFMTSIVAGTLLGCYITLYPSNWIVYLLELSPPASMEFRVLIVFMAFLNFVINFFVERIVVERLSRRRCGGVRKWSKWWRGLWRGRKANRLRNSASNVRFLPPSPHLATLSSTSQFSSITAIRAIDADDLPLIDELNAPHPAYIAKDPLPHVNKETSDTSPHHTESQLPLLSIVNFSLHDSLKNHKSSIPERNNHAAISDVRVKMEEDPVLSIITT